MKAGFWNRVAREDVIRAYELLLGRSPENENVIRGHMRASSLAELRQRFIGSEEFQAAHQAPPSGPLVGRHLTSPPARVQLDGPIEQFDAMLARVARIWNLLGEQEPHWSVLASDAFRQENIAANLDAFYRYGEDNVIMLKAALLRAGLAIDLQWSCFELGCGVGRITSALAREMSHVVGCDISRPHIEIARRYAGDHGLANISFLHLEDIASLDRLPPFDLFFSLIVLQHNPPPMIGRILDRVFAALKPGGFAFFQVPTYCRGYEFDWTAYLATPPGGMEMHMFPQSRLFELFERHGMRCIEVQEDPFAGNLDDFISNTFLVRKLGKDVTGSHAEPQSR